MKLLYFAHPIDGADATQSVDMLDAEIDKLIKKEPGWGVYHPSEAFYVNDTSGVDNKIAHINRIALAKSSGLIAYLPDIPTVGTFMEIATAEESGIPIAWFGSDVWAKHWSLGLKRIVRVRDLEEAVAYILGQSATDKAYVRANSTLRVQRLDRAAKLPTRAFYDDAGFDLYCAESVKLDVDGWADISIGIAVQPPPGYWLRIIGRSSTFRKRGLLVIEGIIDHGYRGLLYVGVRNMGTKPVLVEQGERIAQMILQTGSEHVEAAWARELGGHPRGSAGFGSSGT